jgi:hypothetical protein
MISIIDMRRGDTYRGAVPIYCNSREWFVQGALVAR